MIELKENILDIKKILSKKNYSGKKKCHTKKNTILSNNKMYIWYLWPTVEGKTHDYTMLKDEFLNVKWVFSESNLLLDLWYLWAEKDFWSSCKSLLIPKKKPRKSKNTPDPKLTKKEKETNKIISSFRIKVENAIGGAKRFWITSQIFRNKCEIFNDTIMEIACGLWNFHLSF